MFSSSFENVTMRTRALLVVWCFVSCAHPVIEEPQDSGSDFDAGETFDAGSEVDAGERDAGSEIDAGTDAGVLRMQKKIFVITLENQGVAAVYGNADAPYINELMSDGGYATAFGDVLASIIPSEPHYVWMEAGTNSFSDYTFVTDADPSSVNSTNSTAHLVAQLNAASKTWRAYQEDLNASTGACPIHSSGFYAAKHDPFVFFQDIAGNPPSQTNAECAAHHKAFSALAADLVADDVADYTFITPNLCNDMHGASSCANACKGSSTISVCVSAADTWLANEVPQILSYLEAHDGVLMLMWDEPQSTGFQPFVIIGPHVKHGYVSSTALTQSSYLKSLQELLDVPIFSNVSSANDLAEFFEAGAFP